MISKWNQKKKKNNPKFDPKSNGRKLADSKTIATAEQATFNSQQSDLDQKIWMVDGGWWMVNDIDCFRAKQKNKFPVCLYSQPSILMKM